MGYIIRAKNIETGEVVCYQRKRQKSVVLEGIKYRCFVPYFDNDIRVYADKVHCEMAVTFLRNMVKYPKIVNGELCWLDVWDFDIIEVYDDK